MAEQRDGDNSPLGGRRLALAVAALALVCCPCCLGLLTMRPAVDVNTFYPRKGATKDEVRAEYGPPSQEHDSHDGGATWFYYTDRFGQGFTMVGVVFDADGRVDHSFNH